MAIAPTALGTLTAAARRAASLIRRAGKGTPARAVNASEPFFEALEERTLLAADVQATLTVPVLTGLASAGGTLSGSILLRNTGNAAATGFTYRVFLSTDTVIGNEDDIELTGVDGLTATLAASGTSSVNLNAFTVPTDVRPGAYFLITTLDTTDAVDEGDAGEANNTVSTASPVIVLNGPAAATPNLSATLTFPARTIAPDESINVPTVVRNTGTAAAGMFHVTWVLSTNDIIGDADDIAIDEEDFEGLAAGATATINRDIQLPVGIDLGAYRIGVWVDDRADVSETNEGDNRAISAAGALNVALPDLAATFTTSGGTVAPGSFFSGTLTVRNNTQAASVGFFVTISLSSDNIAGNNDDIQLMTVRIEDLSDATIGLGGGAIRTIAGLRVYIPYGTPDGDALSPGGYRVVVRVDTDAEVEESNETNNSTVTATNIVTIPARDTEADPSGPDMFAYAYPISGTYFPGQTINVAGILANLGNADAGTPTFSAYLSSDNTLDGDDILLSSDFFGEITEFLPGSAYGVARLTIPGSAPNGTFFVILVSDDGNTVDETNEENNNAAAGTATVARPTISITATDAAAGEVTTGAANGGSFRITRTGGTADDLVVTYTVAGTAGEDDFNSGAFTGTVTIPAGQTFVTLNLSAIDDALAENDETVILTVSNDPFYTVSGTLSHATVTIADNEARVSITAVDAAAAEVAAPGVANGGQFRVTRTGSTAAALTVTFNLTGTADDGVDFTVGGTGVTYDATTHSGTVIIPIGATSATFNIVIVDDAVGEDPETVTAAPQADEDLYSVSATAGSATVTIADNEALVTVTTVDPAAAEVAAPGVANGGQYRFTRDGSTANPLVVHFIMQGTADHADDYVLSSTVTGAAVTYDDTTGEGTITIPAGATSVTLNLAVTDDALAEETETAVARLDNDNAYRLGTLAQRSGTVSITDNEPVVTISVVDASAAEVQTGTANGLQFRVSRPAGNTAGALVVHYTLSGTADEGDDYSITGSGTVTILAGQTSALINVAVDDDFLAENAETVIVTLATDDAYRLSTVVAQRSATGSIADNEPIVSLTATDNTASETAPGDTVNNGNFRISRSGDLSQQLTVNVVVSGTASNGDWINFIDTEMVIPAGQAFYDNPVIASDDSIWENTESIVITLSTGDSYHLTTIAAQRTATVTITDNENTVSIAATDPNGAEITTGTQNPVNFRISRTGGSNRLALVVNYTIGGTSTNGDDYPLLSGTITIPAHAAFVDLPISITDDDLGELTETLTLTLAADTSYRLALAAAQRTATASIVDNESTVSITAPDAAAGEVTAPAVANGGQFRIARASGSNTAALTVFFTVSGTGTATDDYTLSSSVTGANLTFDDQTGIGSITIPAGAANVTFNLTVVNDATAETSETAIVTLTADDSYRVTTVAAQQHATVTIADNEPTVTVTAPDAAAGETFTGTTNGGSFRITRTGSTAGALVVHYTLSGTATEEDDYAIGNVSTVTIPSGAAFVDVPVTIADDVLVEGSETIILTIAGDDAYHLSATAAQQHATVTIADNEPTFGVTASDPAAAEGATNTGNFRITRSGGNSQITVVHFSMSGTATAGDDYTLSSTTPGASIDFDPTSGLGTVTFTGTTTQVNIVLTAVTDAVTEGSETAILTIINADEGEQGYIISTTLSHATVNIANTPAVP